MINIRNRRSKKRKREMNCGILYCNINGFKGKSLSVQEIINKTDSTIVVMCETKLGNGNKVKEIIPQYEIIDHCIKLGKGGIMISVKKNTFGSFINVTETENPNILVAKIAVGKKYLRIIAGYAPQEDEVKDVRETFYEDLLEYFGYLLQCCHTK